MLDVLVGVILISDDEIDDVVSGELVTGCKSVVLLFVVAACGNGGY